jgi:hypothetical protein
LVLVPFLCFSEQNEKLVSRFDAQLTHKFTKNSPSVMLSWNVKMILCLLSMMGGDRGIINSQKNYKLKIVEDC